MRKLAKNWYDLSLYALAGSLAGVLYSPAAFVFTGAVLWALGDKIFARLSPEPIEPRRVEKALGDLKAAYDPDAKCWHFLWRAEPLVSALGAESYPEIHKLINALALAPNEAFSFIMLEKKYIRFTTCGVSDNDAMRRALEIEKAITTQYTLKREEPWLGTRKPPAERPFWIVLGAVLAIGFLAKALPFAIPVAALAYYKWHKFKRRYSYTVLPFEAYAASFEGFYQSPSIVDRIAATEAMSFSRAQKYWAVVITPAPDHVMIKKFSKYYESVREKGHIYVKMRRYAEALERIQRGEKFLYLMAFGESAYRGSTTQLKRAPGVAGAMFWKLDHWKEAFSFDLARFPILYGGMHLETERRYINLGVEHISGRDVVVDIDSLPAPHVLVFGGSGMGKSKTMAWLIQQLRDKGVKIAIIDPHGDYRCVAEELGLRRIPQNLIPPLDRAALAKIAVEFGFGRTEEALKELGFEVGMDPPAEYHISLLGMDPVRQSFAVTAWTLYELNRAKDRRSEKLERVLVVDEAYLAKGPVHEMLEFMSRGARKFGLAVFLITQLPMDVPKSLVDMAAVKLVLGGSSEYIADAAAYLNLTREDVSWINSARAPRESGGVVRAVASLAPGALKHHVEIQLPMEVFQCT
ncbi:MAG: DUF87 domain-containing protein [Thermoproteus sp.]